jgi:hypothetical protein
MKNITFSTNKKVIRINDQTEDIDIAKKLTRLWKQTNYVRVGRKLSREEMDER